MDRLLLADVDGVAPDQHVDSNLQICNDNQLVCGVRRLRDRREILRLQQAIDQMQLEVARPALEPVRYVSYQDIESAIVKYSGEDRTYSIGYFFQQLEGVLDGVRADELSRLLALRNSLTGAARLLLRNHFTYEALKGALMREFENAFNVYEIDNALRKRKRRPSESIRRYVLEMEALAHRGQISEEFLVAYVLEGLRGNTVDYQFFLFARNMADVKRLVGRHEQHVAFRVDNGRPT